MVEPHFPCRVPHTRVYAYILDGDSMEPDVYSHVICSVSARSVWGNSLAGPAICGEWPPDDCPDWYGTGDQEELDTARDLPLCPKCLTNVNTSRTST